MKYCRCLIPVLRKARFYLSKRLLPFVERKFVTYSSKPIIVNVRVKIMQLAKDTREIFHYQLPRAMKL